MKKNEEAYWFVFTSAGLLLEVSGGNYSIPRGGAGPVDLEEALDFALFQGISCRVGETKGQIPEGFRVVPLRESYDLIGPRQHALAGKAAQMLYWQQNSRYCPACGTATVPHTEIDRRCPSCGKELYPPISTAAIVLVQKGDAILLVHACYNKRPFMGLVSGFVEPGETLEECVEREVMEETGLSVKNIRYFASQSWPYPSNLMTGFTADYAGGDIRLQKEELDAAGFFTRDSLPELPPAFSLARRMIDAWRKEKEECINIKEPQAHR